MKTLDLSEFQERGYLQEVNRKFFHPLGLALAVMVDEETEKIVGLGPIYDNRDDKEGMIFNEMDLDKVQAVAIEWHERKLVREKALGFMVQPMEHLW